MKRLHLIVISVFCAALSGFLIQWLRSSWSPGIAGEWVWRNLSEKKVPDDALSVLLILLLLAVAVLAAWMGLGRREKRKISPALMLFVILGCGVLFDREIAHNGRMGYSESVLAVTHYFSTGYLTVAAGSSARDLTHDYVRKVLTVPDKEAPHHVHVHPPGNVWLSKVFLCLAERFPLSPPPADLIEACDVPRVQLDAARYLADFFFWSLQAAKILLAWVLFRIAGFRSPPGILLIAFGSSGAILFLGHYDTLYMLISAALVASYVKTRGMTRAALLGSLCAVGVVFTLAYGLAILLFGGMLIAGKKGKEFCVFAASGLAIALLSALCGVDMVSIAFKVMENQHAFNLFADRSWRWIYGNVPDVLLFAGPFTVVLSLWWLTRRRRITFFHWIGVCLLFLTFSTVLRGELGRLLIFFLPFLLFSAGMRLARSSLFPDVCAALWASAMLTMVLRNTLALIIIG